MLLSSAQTCSSSTDRRSFSASATLHTPASAGRLVSLITVLIPSTEVCNYSPLNVLFGLVNIYTNIVLITTELYLPLTSRSLSETFLRRNYSILLPVLATVVMWRGKKSVVRVAQCIAALVPVHRTPSLLSNVHRFLNPSGTSIRLPILILC